MAGKKKKKEDMTPEELKAERVKTERNRLNRLLKDLDGNKKKAAAALVDRAAFMRIELDDLEARLAVDGWTEVYQNGREQSGIKKSAQAEVHISLTKNLTTVLKQLLELVPPEQKKSGLAALRG